MNWLLFLYLLLRLVHVSTLMCHLQGASFILVSYWKSEIIIPLFITQARTCFDTYVSSSGSVLYPCELLKVRNYYSFIYYSGSYMFRHLCVIFRERPLSLWVTESPKLLCHRDVPLYCKCWCAPDVVVSCATLPSFVPPIATTPLEILL
jgi:hypothetical protein